LAPPVRDEAIFDELGFRASFALRDARTVLAISPHRLKETYYMSMTTQRADSGPNIL
jgi:hypothetical protein